MWQRNELKVYWIYLIHTAVRYKDARTPLTIALTYRQLSVVKVLIDAGANINKPTYTREHSKRAPLELTLCDRQMEFTKLLIGAGVDVTSGDWNAMIGGSLASRCTSTKFCKEFLVLYLQAGGTINFELIIRHNEVFDLNQEHPGDRIVEIGRRADVRMELQTCRDGTLYKLTLLYMCRIVIRKKLIENAQGKSILPAIRGLPLPMKMKSFLSFDCVNA